MPSLLDTLDRFNYTSSSIRSLTQSQPPRTSPGPFTAAILQLALHDLLREADEAECGLFSFIREPSGNLVEGPPAQGKVGRREFKEATPLRTKHVVGASRDEEPETYVEAALKYLDRFHTIKPMPHARSHLESLIDRLNSVRDSLDRLQTCMDETGRASPKSQAAEEERRIGELKSRLLQLRKRKEALASKLPPGSKLNPRDTKPGSRSREVKLKTHFPSTSNSPYSTLSTPTAHTSHTASKPEPRVVSSEKSGSRAPGPPSGKSIPLDSNNPISSRLATREEQEEHNESLFWSGGRPPRIIDKSDSLLDEELDMSGMDALMSPPPRTPTSRYIPTTPHEDANDLSAREVSADEDEDDEGSDSGEPTIVVSKPDTVSARATAPSSPPPSRSASQASLPEPQTPIQDVKHLNQTVVPPSMKTKVRRVRINAEVEKVCAKIWNAIPDLLIPGNNFTAPGKHPPNARDTLTVLQTIAAQPIPDLGSTVSSPSTRSTLSSLLGIETLGPAGSPHQIMTAHVLLSLLTEPNHSMPLTTLKTHITSKATLPSLVHDVGRDARLSAAAMGANAAQAGTRALYGCVAKKLVKIDRGGGEQIVRFD